MARTASPVPGTYLVQIVPATEGKREALAMENLVQSLASDEPFCLELLGTQHAQSFLLRASSEESLRTLCHQVQAQYPQAVIRRLAESQDPMRLAQAEHAVIGEFQLRAPTWMPIKTFWDRELSELGSDPLLGLLAAMEAVRPDERIVAQIGLLSAPDGWVQRYVRNTVEHPLTKERDEERRASSLQGQSSASTHQELLLILGGLVALFVGIKAVSWYQAHNWGPIILLSAGVVVGLAILIWWWLHRSTPIYDMQLINKKLMRVAFYTQLRVVVIGTTASSPQVLHVHLDRMELAYRQFNLASANGFILRHRRLLAGEHKRARQLHECRSLSPRGRLARFFRGWSRDILNAREVASMWHLPQAEAEVHLVERLAARRILASPDLFHRTLATPGTISPVIVGYSKHRGHSVPVVLPEAALFTHKLIVGRSGYGKSTLMQLMMLGAMQQAVTWAKQPGIVAVDPHGDFYADLLHQVPPNRMKDVVLLDLEDEQHPIGINLLDAGMGFSRPQAIANLMISFERIWADFFGPRMAYVLKNVLLTLFLLNEQLVRQGRRDEQFTLLDINPLLQHIEYTRQVLAMLDPHDVNHAKALAWWRDYYFKLPPTFKPAAIRPVVSKMGSFSDNPILERIVGQPVTTMDIGAAVKSGAIILANLASGRIEYEAAAIIGGTILNLLHRSLQSQAALPLAERRRILIAVDEFQNIPGADYDSLLSEDRKYGGSLILATQSLMRLEQLRKGLLAMTFSNCNQLYAFATSAKDAEILEKELHEQVEIAHIMNQSPLHCYVRLLLPGHPLQIASFELNRPAGWQRTPASVAQANWIREHNRSLLLQASRVDQLLEAHHMRYLDIDFYMQNLQREIRKTEKAKDQRDQERDLQAAAQNGRTAIGPSLPPSGQATASPPPPTQPGAIEMHPTEPLGQPATLFHSPATAPSQAENQGNGKRHRTRTKRPRLPANGSSSAASTDPPPVTQASLLDPVQNGHTQAQPQTSAAAREAGEQGALEEWK